MAETGNRAGTIKKKITGIFIYCFAALAFLSAILASILAVLRPDAFWALICCASFAVLFISVFLYSMLHLLIELKKLDNYALLDSADINRIIAKNTAPFRKKYYSLYSAWSEKERKTTLLRKELEKLYIKLKQENHKKGQDN